MSPDDPNLEFIKEQYSQYCQMHRFYGNLSWHIPTLAIAAVVAFIGFDPEKAIKWVNAPLLPAVTFLVISIFIALMYIHHRRNLLFTKICERVISEIEKDYGLQKKIYHIQVCPDLKGLDRLSSSIFLSVFLMLLSGASLGVSIYFWVLVF